MLNHHREEIIHFDPLEEPKIVNTLKQGIYELEVLNRNLKQEYERVKAQNEIQRTQNDNILLHLGLWYKKNNKLKDKNKFLKEKVTSLKNIILMKKPRMEINIRKARSTNLDVIT